MRFSPQKGLLARSGTVTLDPENLPVRGLTLFITFVSSAKAGGALPAVPNGVTT